MASLMSFDELFTLYAKFGDPKSAGKAITLSNSDKWMRAAGIIPTSVTRPGGGSSGTNVPESLRFTTTDTGIEFKKAAKTSKAIDKETYENVFLESLARKRAKDDSQVSDIKNKLKKQLSEAGSPTTHSSVSDQRPSSSTSTSGEKVPSVVARLTDHTKYTGTHKHRFDETGKGKGKEGRV